jgi:Tol biopolymer transport system component
MRDDRVRAVCPASPRRGLLIVVGTISMTLLIALSLRGLIHGQEGHGLRDTRERHLKNIRQLTFGGQNAEAYFSADGTRLTFQSTRDPFECDQIFTMNIDGSNVRLVSTGKGRTTCSFFFPDRSSLIYSSTHLGGPACPPKPDRSQGYVWPIYPDYDIFRVDLDGSGLTRLTDASGYDAEAAVSPDGKRIVFTSMRDGDLELYVMNADGTDVRRLTFAKGYDGGPFFSSDGGKIVYRAYHPKAEAEMREYQALLRQNLTKPSRMEIFLMNADGSNQRQITNNGAANFAPFIHPNGRQVIFSSNLHDPSRRAFALYLINVDGTGLERVTYGDTFASFPMFSPDGTKLVFASHRNRRLPGEINIFIADWVP